MAALGTFCVDYTGFCKCSIQKIGKLNKLSLQGLEIPTAAIVRLGSVNSVMCQALQIKSVTGIISSKNYTCNTSPTLCNEFLFVQMKVKNINDAE